MTNGLEDFRLPSNVNKLKRYHLEAPLQKKDGTQKPPNVYLLLTAFIPFLAIATVTLLRAPIFSPDSYSYNGLADLMLGDQRSFVGGLGRLFEAPNVTNYLRVGFIGLVAVLKLASDQHWASLLIGLNMLIVAASIAMLTATMWRNGSQLTTFLVMGLLLLSSFDLYLWPAYVLSDIVFAFVVFSSFVVYANLGMVGKTWYLSVAILIVIGFSLRPTALPFAASFLLYGALRCTYKFFASRLTYLLSLMTTLTIFLTLTAIVLAAYSLFISQAIVEAESGKGYFYDVIHHFANGVVIHDRPEMNVAPVSSFAGVFMLLLTRALAFFCLYTDKFSTPHILLNVTFFVMMAVLITGATGLALSQQRRGPMLKVVALFCCFCASFAVFHSAVLIDYDFRYRLPLVFPGILTTAFCADYLARRGPLKYSEQILRGILTHGIFRQGTNLERRP